MHVILSPSVCLSVCNLYINIHLQTVQEYENVIAGLREQIRHLTLELEEIKYINNIIAQKDKSFLAKTCQDLKKQVCIK